MNIHQFIDNRNKNLWHKINVVLPITLEQHTGSHFYHRFFEKSVALHVPQRDGTIELFTHELLHIDLIMRGITITDFLKERFRQEPLLRWTLNENLFEQIGELLEHVKMLPEYLKMGYQRELFSENYYVHCCHPMTAQVIRLGMMKKVPTPASVDLFIHKFFAIRTNQNPEFDYSEHLDFLKSVCPELYGVLEEFWQKWDAYEINKQDFKGFTTLFVQRLGMWTIENRYAKEMERA
jgi:hypothetical protein